jgi:hypothetical protein
MKSLKFVCLALVTAGAAQAAAGLLTYNVEPIIGYERTQKLLPTAHTRDRLVYGARITAGIPLVSAEAEYTRARDSEDFPALTQTIVETADRARIGLRSSLQLSGFLHAFLRAGAQASLSRHDTTTGGVLVSTVDPIRYRPYAGAGFRGRIASNISLNVDITTVFHDFPNMNNNDYLTTASLSVSFP